MYGNINHVGLHAFQLQLIKEDYYNPPIKKYKICLVQIVVFGFYFLSNIKNS